MTKKLKKTLAFLLTVSMLTGMLGTAAFAAENEESPDAIQLVDDGKTNEDTDGAPAADVSEDKEPVDEAPAAGEPVTEPAGDPAAAEPEGGENGETNEDTNDAPAATEPEDSESGASAGEQPVAPADEPADLTDEPTALAEVEDEPVALADETDPLGIPAPGSTVKAPLVIDAGEADVTIEGVTFCETGLLTVNTTGKVTLTNCTFGPYDTDANGKVANKNAMVILNATSAEITGNTFKGFFYNGLEFSQKAAYSLERADIADNTFENSIKHINFSFFELAEGAEINISGTVMKEVPGYQNFIRISNYSNIDKATFNLSKNTINFKDGVPANQLPGLVLFQDTAGDQDFTGILLNITDLTYVGGKPAGLVGVLRDNTQIFDNDPIITGDETVEEFFVASVHGRMFTTLQDAIDAAGDGQTVTLVAETVAESVTVGEEKNIILDLNGKTLKGAMVPKYAHKNANDSTTYYAMENVITNKGTLTIKDSAWEGIDAEGNVLGEGPVGTIMGGTDDGTTKYISWYKDGVGQYTYPGRSGIAIVNEENATCTIQGGVIKRGDDKTFGNYTVQNKGHMIVEDGLITNNSNVSNLVVNFTKKKNAENKDSYINGCEAVMDIKGGMLRQDNMSALKNDPGGVLNISGDAALIWRVASENNYATNFYGTVNMTGGTIKTNGVIPLFTWKEGTTEFPAEFNISGNAKLECNVLESNNGVMGGYNDAYVIDQQPVINISGNPTITVNRIQTVCSIGNVMTDVENGTKATINVKGGTFSTPVDPQYCAEGYLPIANGDDTYGVANETLTITPNRTSQSGSGTVTLTVTPANLTAEVEVTCSDETVTVARNENGTFTTSRLPNTTAEYTFTATVGKNVATCTVNVTRYTAPTTGGTTVTTPVDEEDLEDEDTPLADKPFLFEDVAETDWFYESVKYVFDHDLMTGTSETRFSPYMLTGRGMVVTLLHRLEGEPEGGENLFPDVAEGQWYTNAVVWAVPAGVAKGYDDGNFGPEDTVTREQLALFLFRYAELKGYDVTGRGDIYGFTDFEDVSDWALEAVQWAVGEGLLKGTGTGLDPQGNASRSEMAAVMARFAQAHAEADADAEKDAE